MLVGVADNFSDSHLTGSVAKAFKGQLSTGSVVAISHGSTLEPDKDTEHLFRCRFQSIGASVHGQFQLRDAPTLR